MHCPGRSRCRCWNLLAGSSGRMRSMQQRESNTATLLNVAACRLLVAACLVHCSDAMFAFWSLGVRPPLTRVTRVTVSPDERLAWSVVKGEFFISQTCEAGLKLALLWNMVRQLNAAGCQLRAACIAHVFAALRCSALHCTPSTHLGVHPAVWAEGWLLYCSSACGMSTSLQHVWLTAEAPYTAKQSRFDVSMQKHDLSFIGC